ncbi:glycosyltransferase [Patescibacteria group bacterium]|nr:glycosyltransferase [Patescibacteria group bacterium]
MAELDIIVPVYNEGGSIEELTYRLSQSLTKAGIDYGIIFIDDRSTDDSAVRIKEAALKYNDTDLIYDSLKRGRGPNGVRIKLLNKKGKQGKAYSILEGARISKAPYIAMIDGDLQYPPEAIPEMYRLAHNHGVVVAKRKMNGISPLRKVGSKVNILFFEKLLLSLDCDAQSGLKVFKREIIENLTEADVSPWTLDVPLLLAALELGHNIGTLDIDFSDRRNGESSVNFFKTGAEIALSAIKLRAKSRKTYAIKPENGDLTVGAGVFYNARRFITHTHLPQEQSALVTFKPWQKLLLLSTGILSLLGLIANPVLTGIVIVSFLSILYITDLLFSLLVILKSLHVSPEISVGEEELERLKDEALPTYSILCPLYKEANILSQFLEAIDLIDWPKEKLDVLLLLEQDDKETLDAVQSLDLPNYIRVLVVPPSLPKTKPKACNFGFAHAKGEYVVIYDAEDRPDPLQLKKAYCAFSKLSSDVVCLQSKLSYYNKNQNLLTRLFTAEYSLWFDLVLPGLQSIKTTIPLGGTSNHFKSRALRYLDAWDPFNVTEDCDLGARLFKAGFKTAIIDSTTFEEANSNIKNWLRQRSRWIKGYMQTYLVHIRDPINLFARQGIHALVFQMIIGMRMVFILINPILWLVTLSYFTLNSLVGPTIEALYPAPIFYIAVTSLIFGNFIYLYNYMIGCAKRGLWGLMGHVFLVPLYWLAASVAAWIALYQLIYKPHYWEKTKHGLHLSQEAPETDRSAFSKNRLTSLGRKRLVFIYQKLGKITVLLNLIELFKGPARSGKREGEGIRILVYNWRDTKHNWAGGAEIYIHELAKRWIKQGHSVTLFCGNDGKGARDEYVEGVYVVRRGGFFTVYVWAFLYYLFRFRGKYDVIIDCENGIPFFTPLYSRLPKILLLHHVHQEIFRERFGIVLTAIAKFLELKLMPLVYRETKMITVSESSKQDMETIGLGRNIPIDIVNPAIEPFKFSPGRKTSNPSVLYLGRLMPWKSIDTLIKAMTSIINKFPEARLKIAGLGESRESLEALVNRLGLEDCVEFLGKVSEAAKVKLLGESWVFAYPSLMEGWGITAIEASASGTAVVASDVPGLNEAVRNPSTGLLVEKGDVYGFAEKINLLLYDDSLRESLESGGIRWARNFTWDKSADTFLKIVEKVVEKKVAVLSDETLFASKENMTRRKKITLTVGIPAYTRSFQAGIKNKASVTIGITAYNEIKTIKSLISDLLRQETQLVSLDEIIVVSDGSTDGTTGAVRSVKDERVTLIEGKTRRGKANRQNEIIERTTSDILVLLDADTAIDDKSFLQELTKPIVFGKSDMTSALLDEFPPRTFLEKSLDVSMKVKRVLFGEFKDGNNIYECHGPARAFTKSVYKNLRFKDSLGEDMYSYFVALSQGKRFTFVPEAIIRYRLPSTYSDHSKQSVRFLNARQKYINEFGLKARLEFDIPFLVYLKTAVKCLPIILRNPAHSSAYLAVYSLTKIESLFRKNVENTWQVHSSKALS